MNFLKEWVRGLVMLVLLAGCLELVLPMNNMKKYVRLAMSLFVVLAVVKPIFGFLHQPVTVDTALLDGSAGTAKRLPSMAEIMAQADQFRAKNQGLALTEMELKMAAQSEEAARAVQGVAEAAAVVELTQTGSEVQVKSVTVTVRPGAPGGVKPVTPVTPVGGATPAPQPHVVTDAEKQLADAVRREVAARLGIKGDTVQVQVGELPDSQRR